MIVEATVINSEPFDGTITCCSAQTFIDIYIEQVYDITMSTGESNPNQPNSDGNRCDSGRDGEPAAISGDLVGASEGAPELDELVAIAAQRCRLDHRESVLLAEIAQTDVCDVLHGHHPNVWFADRTRQARYTASSRMRTAQRLHNRYGELADALAAGVVGWQHVVVFDRAANSRIRAAMIELLPGIINLAQVATFERWSQEVRGIADRLDQDGGYDPATDPTNNQLHLVPTTGGITYISGQLVGELALTIKKLIDGETDRVLTRYRSDAEASDGDIPVPSRAQAAAEALGELVDRASSIPDATGKLPEPEIVVILNDQTGDLTDDAGNPVVEHCVQLIWRMRNELPRVRQVYANVCHNDGDTRNDEHTAILDGLRLRDPGAARTAMRNHFQRLFESMLEATENEALAEIRRRTQQDRERFLAATAR